MQNHASEALQRLIDRAAIEDVMRRYARAVDRGDWELLRSVYHPDAYDDHGEYKGDIDGLIKWLDRRFANVDNSMHFLGNCLMEFAGPDLALVETYFVSRRLRPSVAHEDENASPGDAMCRQAWGRYVDRFERANGEWRIAYRLVIIDASFTSLAKGGERTGNVTWGMRNESDGLYAAHDQIFGEASKSSR